MELEEIISGDGRFSHHYNGSSCREEELRLREYGDYSSETPVLSIDYPNYPTATKMTNSSSIARWPSVRRVMGTRPDVLAESHPRPQFTRSPSSLSSVSGGSVDSETGLMRSSKSSPGNEYSMNNYTRLDPAAISSRTVSMNSEMQAKDRLLEEYFPPSPSELSEVFAWIDENNDGLICRSDLRGFMSRVLAFEILEDEAESLLLYYGNGLTKIVPGFGKNGRSRGAVVDLDGFLALYQCLCGEQASPEEQSMMEAATRVFDESQLESGRWI